MSRYPFATITDPERVDSHILSVAAEDGAVALNVNGERVHLSESVAIQLSRELKSIAGTIHPDDRI